MSLDGVLYYVRRCISFSVENDNYVARFCSASGKGRSALVNQAVTEHRMRRESKVYDDAVTAKLEWDESTGVRMD